MLPRRRTKVIRNAAWGLAWLALQYGMAAAAAAAPAVDPTEAALTRCLARDDHVSTAGQAGCEEAARDAYDRRLNAAYGALTRLLPPPAVEALRRSQRSWLLFRDAEAKAREALYATRQGTMYVPMEADDEAMIVRDRARQLESYLRVMRIDR
jgi:uncharacterized protein YecT (DUF1311 family)